MHPKKVKYILPSGIIDMDGIPVKQAFPTQNVPRIDPFLLLHHLVLPIYNDRPARHQGVGPHPHRGFTTVTFVINGELQHRDSRGNNQIAKKGEVQWMHTGAGIIHSERPSKNVVNREESCEYLQLWINSPANRKMQIPEYVHITQSEMQNVTPEEKGIESRLIGGSYRSFKGKAVPQSPLFVLWCRCESGAHASYVIPEGYHSAVYLLKGAIRIVGYGIVDEESLVLFHESDGEIGIESRSDAQFILFAGQPLNEKVVQQGPFVMNTETEILEAMRDYRMGKMGFLVEED